MNKNEMNEVMNARRNEADAYSEANNLPKWGVRVAWFVISEGTTFARSACCKYNKQSRAWRCYLNLLESGLIEEEKSAQDGTKGGIYYTPCEEWEVGDGPLKWFAAVAAVAEGQERHPLL